MISALILVSALQELDYQEFRTILVLHNKRTKPIDTYAREFLWNLTGSENTKHLGAKEPVEALLMILSDPQKYQKTQLINIENERIKRKLGLNHEFLSFTPEEIGTRINLLINLIKELEREEGDKGPNYLASTKLYGQYARFNDLVMGNSLKIIPYYDDWISVGWLTENMANLRNGNGQADPTLPNFWTKAKLLNIFDTYKKVIDSFKNRDATNFKQSSLAFKTELTSMINDLLMNLNQMSRNHSNFRDILNDLTLMGTGEPSRAGLEVFYNFFRPASKSTIFYFLGLASVIILAILKRNLWAIPASLLGIAIFFHVYDLILRHLVAARAPWSNMYESLIALSGATALVCLILELFTRTKYFALAGCIASPLIILFASSTPVFDPYISPVLPALKSFWMTIHVPAMMLGYGATAVMMIIGHVMIFQYLAGKQGLGNIEQHMYRAHQVAALFLLGGISLGAVWAAEAWGRPWGWDTKETWALISFLFYLFMLHGRLVKFVKGIGYAIGSLLGFILIIFTYYGVNVLFSKGLHTYGFGSGPDFIIYTFCGIELIIIMISVAFYLARRERTQQAV